MNDYQDDYDDIADLDEDMMDAFDDMDLEDKIEYLMKDECRCGGCRCGGCCYCLDITDKDFM